MATDLGKAYVQIMPSAQGIKGQVEKVLGKELDNVGEKTGKGLFTSITKSLSGIGNKMTKAITLPAMGAATAVGGLVSAIGFKRLVGMDVAQDKLRGMGYEGKQLDTIMQSARNAVQGTTFATADGAYVAAGALAAGVKEGAELERYIKLVGDAAIGSGAPIEEMAQIFNRVQSAGHLTRNELEMINYRLPGFSNAMMEHVGAKSEDAFYEMLRAGKVSSEDMLTVMDDFAGGMSEAYATTWSGLKDNVLANIGIIGEALLEGLFEDGKKGMAEFLDFLRNSDGLKKWAQETGEKLRLAFQKIVEVIKDVINWWNGLSDGAKKFIGIVSGILIAIGPIMLIVSKIITTVMALIPVFKALGVVIGAIASPIGLVVAAIIGAVALIYIYWEPIKEFFINLWESIKEAGLLIWENLKEGWADAKTNLMEGWQSIKEFFFTLWENVKEIFMTVWNAISTAVTTVINAIKTGITTVFNAVKAYFTTILSFYMSLFSRVWNAIRTVITTVVNTVRTIITNVFNTIRSIITSVMSVIRTVITTVWSGIRNTISTIVNGIRNVIRSIFNSLRGIVSGAMSRVSGAVKSGMSSAFNAVTGFFGKFRDAGKNIVGAIADGIKAAVGKVTDAIKNVTQKVRDFLPFSPPKTGPLIDIMDVKWGETISAGILKGEDHVANAMDEILDLDLTKKARFNGVNNDNGDHSKKTDPQPIVLQIDGVTFAQIIGDYTSAEGGKRIRRIERGLA